MEFSLRNMHILYEYPVRVHTYCCNSNCSSLTTPVPESTFLAGSVCYRALVNCRQHGKGLETLPAPVCSQWGGGAKARSFFLASFYVVPGGCTCACLESRQCYIFPDNVYCPCVLWVEWVQQQLWVYREYGSCGRAVNSPSFFFLWLVYSFSVIALSAFLLVRCISWAAF